MGFLPEKKEMKQNKWALQGRISYREKLIEQLKRKLRGGIYPVKIKVPITNDLECQKRMEDISKQARNDMAETLIKYYEVRLAADKERLENVLINRKRDRRESLKKALAVRDKERREKPYEGKKRTGIIPLKKSVFAELQAELTDLKKKYSQMETELRGVTEPLSSEKQAVTVN